MPKLPPNIERAGFNRRRYTGHSAVGAWTIARMGSVWFASCQREPMILYARTLAEMGEKLAAVQPLPEYHAPTA